jgi:hypothetical protein
MAVYLDMNRGHISDIERGKREVGIITLQHRTALAGGDRCGGETQTPGALKLLRSNVAPW